MSLHLLHDAEVEEKTKKPLNSPRKNRPDVDVDVDIDVDVDRDIDVDPEIEVDVDMDIDRQRITKTVGLHTVRFSFN